MKWHSKILVFSMLFISGGLSHSQAQISPPQLPVNAPVQANRMAIDTTIAVTDSLPLNADSLTIATPATAESGFDTTLFYEAHIVDTDIDSNRYFLIGDAVVKYRNMTLSAAKITVDQKMEILIAEGVPETTYVYNADSTLKEPHYGFKGTPVFAEGGEKLNGFRMIYNYRSEKGRVIRGRTDYESGKYGGEHLKKVAGKVLNVTNGYFTTCDREDEPHFHFQARRMKIIPQKEVVAKPLVMYIQKIPVAYLPFVFFPNKGGRHSGIIIPRYGESAIEGRYLQGLGYFWAPSPYFDVTAKVNYYDRSGWLADGRFRYKLRYVLDGSVSGSVTKKEAYGGSQQNRWDLRIYHHQEISPTLRLHVNGTFISDANYYRSYSSNLEQRLNRQLNSNATLTKSWTESKNNMTLNIQHSKNLENNQQTLLLPQISFYHGSRQLFPPQKDKMRRSTVRRRDTPQTDTDRWYHSIYYSYNSMLINQTRTGQSEPIARKITHSASLSMNSPQKVFGWLGWNHGLSYSETWYDRYKSYYYDADRDSTDTDSVKSKTVRGFASLRSFGYNASANTKIYGMFAPHIGNVVAIRHVLTPSVSFSYAPDFTKPLWGYYQEVRNPAGQIIPGDYFKFLGGYAATGQKSVYFTVANLFQMKTASVVDGQEKEKKFDLFMLDFNSGYNFKADSLKMSPLSASLSANPTQNMSVRLSSRHDFYEFDSKLNRRVNQFLPFKGHLPWLTSFLFNINLRLQGKKKSTPKEMSTHSEEAAAGSRSLEATGELPPYPGYEEETDRFAADENFAGLEIPWSASFSLDYSLYKSTPIKANKTVYLRISNVQVQLTKNWSLSYQAHYDLTKKQLVSQSFNFHRDLHCWEMTFRWVPSGIYKEYYLRLNIKASQLQDIKLEKQGGRSSIRGYGYY
ncbi:LPS assembly protein LptD [candidate division KSB1 bacterium]|nr:LPS assembly protein LptD [candidate division KSB1 bacterium]